MFELDRLHIVLKIVFVICEMFY